MELTAPEQTSGCFNRAKNLPCKIWGFNFAVYIGGGGIFTRYRMRKITKTLQNEILWELARNARENKTKRDVRQKVVLLVSKKTRAHPGRFQ